MNSIKKCAVFIFVFLVLNIFIIRVNAETTSCEYDDLGITATFDESGTATITQNKYDDADHQIPIIGWLYTKRTGGLEYVNELKHIEMELYGSCPEKIYACAYEKIVWGDLGLNVIIDDFIPEDFIQTENALVYSQNKKIFLFYSENNMKDNETLANLPNDELVKGTELYDNFKDNINYWDEVCGGVCAYTLGILGGIGNDIVDIIGFDINGDGGGIDFYYKEYKNCNYVNYTGDLPTYNLACPNLNIYLGRFNVALNQFKDCSETDAVCKSKAITNVNEKETLIKDYCKSIMQEQDYDGGTEQDCIDACLNIAVQTTKAKKAAGLLSENSGNCGVSGRMLVWVSNIMKWIKYILPVIVIVMGILDFIKAIGADKEDEMKKAQSKFIKRLIAAALVFLVPLIIEFALDKMGFGYNDCGIL